MTVKIKINVDKINEACWLDGTGLASVYVLEALRMGVTMLS